MIQPTKKMVIVGLGVFTISVLVGGAMAAVIRNRIAQSDQSVVALEISPKPPKPTLDRKEYDRRLMQLAHVAPATVPDGSLFDDVFAGAVSGVDAAQVQSIEDAPAVFQLWPVKAAYPKYGAILPFKRIVAYYGNFYSTGMGVLGEYSEDVMLLKLKKEVAAWEAADPNTPVLPAIDYIAMTAQLSSGKDGMYRFRMPDDQIDKALALAEKVNGIVILEVQPGFADILGEVKSLEKYLMMPQVHLALDPEFAMRKSGARPGTLVGTVDAAEVNAVAEYLADLVCDNELTPKVLIVHRYTRAMVTHSTKIKPLPEVQVVMDMDGWGPPAQKFSTYNSFIYPEPVQFTGFKLFYKNDVKRQDSRLLTPAQILELTPQPSFIQYQ